MYLYVYVVQSFYFIEVQLIYNVGLISAVQKSDLHVYGFFHIFPIILYYSILNIVVCPIQ